jgi:hypothetical protein
MFRPIAKFLGKLKPLIVTEVPADTAACEFDCRQLDCSEQDWQNCPNRIQKAEAIRSLENPDPGQSS